ncbi:MAG: hypothetical protein HWD59_14825 [Coxiellaceae bacterium]|nr:MAG: hypothetical protein HWD59_14825 [Coxiellaceae bacterium]
MPIKHAINFLDALDSDHPDDSMHIIKGIGLLAASFPKKIHIDVLKSSATSFAIISFPSQYELQPLTPLVNLIVIPTLSLMT